MYLYIQMHTCVYRKDTYTCMYACKFVRMCVLTYTYIHPHLHPHILLLSLSLLHRIRLGCYALFLVLLSVCFTWYAAPPSAVTPEARRFRVHRLRSGSDIDSHELLCEAVRCILCGVCPDSKRAGCGKCAPSDFRKAAGMDATGTIRH